ncbi:hypothetical protein FQA47_006801 [Oryzias melastigma]|uniref:Uncharacterized protein n=1 Tax=Oryzias melastigma TaxID=30732 RepID=A0A834FAE9_ORYME|nr:hypothetical protein FQA47_006801 [Oryzias melastigma]
MDHLCCKLLKNKGGLVIYRYLCHRLVENLDGPLDQPTKSTLLVKAVKDCFIGQHFIFGLKFNETGSEPWCQRPPYDGFNREERAQFIASQMLPSTPGGPTGCTVVRLEEQDSTLTFTPPWEQSLGLVTSSAEQEEPCRTLDKEDVTTKQTVDSTEPHLVQRVDEENHEVCVEEDREAHWSLEKDSYNCSADLFSGSFMSSVDTDVPDVTVVTAAHACTLDCKMDQHHLSKKLINITNSTPLNHKQRSGKRRKSFNSLITEDFDFVPPSQSTPVMKTNSRKKDEKKRAILLSFIGPQRRTPNLDSKKAVCDEEDGILAPTPAAKSQPNGILRGRRFPEKGSSYFTLKKSQEDRDDCKRTLLLTSPYRLMGEKENGG